MPEQKVVATVAEMQALANSMAAGETRDQWNAKIATLAKYLDLDGYTIRRGSELPRTA